jgi:hypothetical protein
MSEVMCLFPVRIVKNSQLFNDFTGRELSDQMRFPGELHQEICQIKF